MKTKTKTFAVAGGRLVFGDPCYDTNPSYPARNGMWTAHVVMGDGDGWGSRVKKVFVHHVDFNPVEQGLRSVKEDFSVDSGQAGVFDGSAYGGEEFYSACCKKTLTDKQCGYLPNGFVSSSGYGDGWYEAEVKTVGGKAVCIEITFIGD